MYLGDSMSIMKKIFSGYRQTVGTVFEAKEFRGDVLVEVIVPKDRIKRLFTGDIELEKLKNKQVKLNIGLVHTEDKEDLKKKEEEIDRLKEEIKRRDKERRKLVEKRKAAFKQYKDQKR